MDWRLYDWFGRRPGGAVRRHSGAGVEHLGGRRHRLLPPRGPSPRQPLTGHGAPVDRDQSGLAGAVSPRW